LVDIIYESLFLFILIDVDDEGCSNKDGVGDIEEYQKKDFE